ncbi:MAG: hypothetical protein V3R65_05070 [Acidiferrobacterales bacterium]
MVADLTALFLSPLLVSCTTPTVAVPNPLLTMDCDYPVLQNQQPTYRDVVHLAEKRGEALKECTDRMRAMRKAK